MVFLPHTFRGGGYEVTVNRNRSIKVKQGDWLSKYSMAIYGDFDHIKKFKRVVNGQYAEIDNPDLIRTGEILYHLDPLPGEDRRGPRIIIPVPGTPPGEEAPGAELPLQARHIVNFLRWVNARFVDSGWRVTSTGGLDLSLIFFSGQYATIGLRNNNNLGSDTQWVHAVSLGFAFGWPESVFGIAGSTTQMPDVGWILRTPALHQLTLDDFRFGVIVVEVGANFVFFVGGGSLSLVFFGIGVPITYAVGYLNTYFRTGDPDLLNKFLMKCLPGGVMVLLGSSLGLPSVGVVARLGVMYDRGYWGV
jgi:hypothetical protein